MFPRLPSPAKATQAAVSTRELKLDRAGTLNMLTSMSIAEIKEEARQMPAKDVQFLAAFFHHLARRHDLGYAVSLDDAAQALETGEKVTLAEVRRLEAELQRAKL